MALHKQDIVLNALFVRIVAITIFSHFGRLNLGYVSTGMATRQGDYPLKTRKLLFQRGIKKKGFEKPLNGTQNRKILVLIYWC